MAEPSNSSGIGKELPPNFSLKLDHSMTAAGTSQYQTKRDLKIRTVAKIDSTTAIAIPHYWYSSTLDAFTPSHQHYLPKLIAEYLTKYNPVTCTDSSILNFVIRSNYTGPIDTQFYLMPVFGLISVHLKNVVLHSNSKKRDIVMPMAPGSSACFNRILVKRSNTISSEQKLSNQILMTIHDLAYNINKNLPQDSGTPSSAKLARCAMLAYQNLCAERCQTAFGMYIQEHKQELYDRFLETVETYVKTRHNKILRGQMLATGANALAEYANGIMPVNKSMLDDIYQSWRMTELPNPDWLMAYFLEKETIPETPFRMFPFCIAEGQGNGFSIRIAPYLEAWNVASNNQNFISNASVYSPRGWPNPPVPTVNYYTRITCLKGQTDSILNTTLPAQRGIVVPQAYGNRMTPAATEELHGATEADVNMPFEYGVPITKVTNNQDTLLRLTSQYSSPKITLVTLRVPDGDKDTYLKILALNGALNTEMHVQPKYRHYTLWTGTGEAKIAGSYPGTVVKAILQSAYRTTLQCDNPNRSMYLSEMLGN